MQWTPSTKKEQKDSLQSVLPSASHNYSFNAKYQDYPITFNQTNQIHIEKMREYLQNSAKNPTFQNIPRGV